tara:strand:+ start:12582 stop:13733 length:1152 start_codon:yes stop_codon:yes gene_type:complete
MRESFDYIICGAGASGLLLANSMIEDDFFRDKKILLIEKDNKSINDRTWGFWDNKVNVLDSIIFKSWDNAEFVNSSFRKNFSLSPYKYMMVKAVDFYSHFLEKIDNASNFEYVNASISEIVSNTNHNYVNTSIGKFSSKLIFSSLPLNNNINFNKYPLLNQSFIGWTIETVEDVFDENKMTLMDFDRDQKNETRFIYTLPFSSKRALIEYTLFSETLISDKEYEDGIKEYLNKRGINDYRVLEKEKGNIPMTCFPFEKSNTDKLIYIGTAGGWTKPSTGYTIKNTIEKTEELVSFIQSNQSLKKFKKRNRFWYYDLLLLDVLKSTKGNGYKVFSYMFKRNNPIKILKFLDEKTNLNEELPILLSVNKIVFIKAFLNRVFKKPY